MHDQQTASIKFTIPASLRDEDHIKLSVLKSYIHDRRININLYSEREAMLDAVENHASVSSDNFEEFQIWLDGILKEGQKEIFIHAIDINPDFIKSLDDEVGLIHYLSELPSNQDKSHVCTFEYNPELQLINADYDPDYQRIQLIFGIMLHAEKSNEIQTIIYPIFVDLYLKLGVLVSRAKPKPNLYYINGDDFERTSINRVTVEKLINKTIELAKDIFEFKIMDDLQTIVQFKSKIYKLLDLHTKTPIEINEIIKSKDAEINDIVNSIQSICSVDSTYQEKICFDIKNIVEKYLSISWPNPSIFIKDRKAYPIQLNATDDEESTVDQSSYNRSPLQSREVFFDNKRILLERESCDGVTYRWDRITPKYFSDRQFSVRILMKKSACVLKFTEYTREEDIEDVLFSIVGTD